MKQMSEMSDEEVDAFLGSIPFDMIHRLYKDHINQEYESNEDFRSIKSRTNLQTPAKLYEDVRSGKIIESLSALGPIIIVYDEPNRDGTKQPFTVQVDDLRRAWGRGALGFGNWNDEIQSFEVVSGIWRFWKDIKKDCTAQTPHTAAFTAADGPKNMTDVWNYGKEASYVELIGR